MPSTIPTPGSALPDRADVVVCGAGIAGIAAAHQLAMAGEVGSILLLDDRAPLSLTSDKSTECYRNWWPAPDGAMVDLMNRSIDLLESVADRSGNAIGLNRRGYLFASSDPGRAEDWRKLAERGRNQGVGPLRIHDGREDVTGGPPYAEAAHHGYQAPETGCDLILGSAIKQAFPYLGEKAKALLHVRRCGWFSGQQLGMHLLEEAREHGVVFRHGHITGVEQDRMVGKQQGRVTGVRVRDDTGEHIIGTNAFVIAAGPFLKPLAEMVGWDAPVFTELHLKASFQDRLGIIPREAPMLIWEEPQTLAWPDDMRETLAQDKATAMLTGLLPGGVHVRPEGGMDSRNVLILWNVAVEPVEPRLPPPVPPHYLEVALKGLEAMIPAVEPYGARLPRAVVDGGYYTRTEENRPLIGPLPLEGAYVIGALSGFGLMGACAAGELLAAHVRGDTLPPYAPAFHPARFDNPDYLAPFRSWGGDGQL